MKITIDIDDEIAQQLQDIEDMTGRPLDLVDDIIRYLNQYTDENGELDIREAWLYPSDYEIRAIQIEESTAGKDVSNASQIRERRKKNVFVLDTNCKMMGVPYMKIYDRARGSIVKVPAQNVEII